MTRSYWSRLEVVLFGVGAMKGGGVICGVEK